MKKTTLQRLLVAAVLLAWPILVDQQALACWISWNDCSLGGPIAFILKITSLIIGGGLISLTLPLGDKGWGRWAVRLLVVIAIFLVIYLITFFADFQREFTI